MKTVTVLNHVKELQMEQKFEIKIHITLRVFRLSNIIEV
jgi:hypothetical protein